jgi:antitoxin PrlF
MSRARAKMSSKNQVVVPGLVREKLGLGPGDNLEFEVDTRGVRVTKGTPADDPFAAFSEWSGEADEEAYKDL